MRLAYKRIYYFDICFLLSYEIWVNVGMSLFFTDCKLRESMCWFGISLVVQAFKWNKIVSDTSDFETQAVG